MDQPHPSNGQVEGWLQTLGVASLSQWDVLVFLYRHQASLLSAEHIARLVGHETNIAVTALDVLEALGLVERSRVSQAARLYQFTAPGEPPRGDALDRLLHLAADRAGRVLLAAKLRPVAPPAQDNGCPRVRPGGGGRTWLRAI